jgi:hypothetical protein
LAYSLLAIAKGQEKREIFVLKLRFITVLILVVIATSIVSLNAAPVVTEPWQYSSETSAFIYWQSTEPARSYVEYGLTTSYGSQTVTQGINTISGQAYFTHSHRLTGLSHATTYHFRRVMIDVNDQIVLGSDSTFTTADYPGGSRLLVTSQGSNTESGGAVYQYYLNQSSRTYVLTSDITVDQGAIWIAGNDITLDLDGHTVTYNNVADGTRRQRIGVYAVGDRIKIFNGTVIQGAGQDGGNTSTDASGIGHNPIFVNGSDQTEVAYMNLQWGGSQVSGLMNYNAGPGSKIHHNVLYDTKTGIDAVLEREIMVRSISTSNTGYEVYNNLIKRARHGAIITDGSDTLKSVGLVHNNEVYIDSWCTNAYAVWFSATTQNSKAYNNRIYGTGYHVVGIGTTGGTSGNEIYSNYIELWADTPVNRCPNTPLNSGTISSMNGFRILWGEVHDNNYHDNTVIVHGKNGGRARGTWFITVSCDSNGENCVQAHDNTFRNNTVISYRDSSDTNPDTDVCSLRALGDNGETDSLPMIYENNLISSNVCNVSFADEYAGRPTNHVLINNRIRKIGNESFYNTIHMGFNLAYDNYGHIFRDNILEGGASLENFYWECFGSRCDYSVEWTLTIRAVDGSDTPLTNAIVTIADSGGNPVPGGNTTDGIFSTVLRQYIRNGSRPADINLSSPYTITVSYGGSSMVREVSLDETKTELFKFDGLAADTTPPANTGDLSFVSSTSQSCTLALYAPGDDWTTGIAYEYDLRYSLSEINDSNWAGAISVIGEDQPIDPGTVQELTAEGLTPETTYYFALKTSDDVRNWSALSNVVSCTTAKDDSINPPGPGDDGGLPDGDTADQEALYNITGGCSLNSNGTSSNPLFSIISMVSALLAICLARKREYFRKR